MTTLRRVDSRVVFLVLITLFVLVVVVYPLVQVLIRSILVDGRLSFVNYEAVFGRPRNYVALWNSVWVSLAATVLATIIGTLAAFVVQRTDVPFKPLLRFLLILPFAIPPLFAAMGWVQLAGPVGILSKAYQGLFGVTGVPWSIYGAGGIIFVLGITKYPFVFITVAGALQRMDASLEEAARTTGAGTGRIMRDITLPLVRPAILGGALLAFVSSIDNFGIPAVLGLRVQFQVLTTRIYEALTIPDLPLATAMSMLLVVLAGVAIWALGKFEGRRGEHAIIGGKSIRPHIIRLGPARPWVTLALGSTVALIVVLPLLALVVTSLQPYYGAPLTLENITPRNYEAVLGSSAAQRGIRNSLLLAPAAATILVIVTALLAYLNVKARMPGTKLLDAIGMVPFALPGSVIGIGMILAWSNPPVGPTLYGTLWILLVAYLMRYMAYGLRACRASLMQIHDSLEEAAATSGANRIRTLRDVTLPLMRPGMIAAWVLIFMSAFNELTVSVLIWSARNETIGVWIFVMQDSGFAGRASALAVSILPIILIMFVITQWLSAERVAI
ncbi:MAG: iron ABC transporter permease [Trueperaceae bacterium]|nr:iron ABC transporter permease [Trueperaceae bacterium]